MFRTMLCVLFAGASFAITTETLAHGRAGNRLFPATLAIEDPGIADELTLPLVRRFRESEDDDADWVTEAEGEFSKRLTDRLGVSVEGGYAGGEGFDNVGLGVKYRALTDAAHETVFSLGLGWDVGGTGGDNAEDSSTFTPQVFFGKGFGDLPDSARQFRPLALTGAAGVDIPAGGGDSALNYGFTLQYSLPYRDHTKSGFIPLIEFAFASPFEEGKTTGTANPGILWSDGTVQIGLEAVLPLNDATGKGVGAALQVHFYLDDLFGGD